MSHPFNVKKRIHSFIYAWKGIRSLFSEEQNAWIHAGATCLVIFSGCFFRITSGEWIVLLLCIGMVLMAEAINTSIERLVDLVSPEFHPLAGKVKDLAAGAVLIGAVIAAIIGLIIFVPYGIRLFI